MIRAGKLYVILENNKLTVNYWKKKHVIYVKLLNSSTH